MENDTKYTAHQEGVEQELDAATLEDALQEAREWMRDGDYTGALDDMRQGERPRTVHEHLRIDRGDETVHDEWLEVVSIEDAIEYAEPQCEDPAGHDWRDVPESVRSAGGLHYYHRERCTRCGMERSLHSDGQAMVGAGQPSEWVEYIEAADDDEAQS